MAAWVYMIPVVSLCLGYRFFPPISKARGTVRPCWEGCNGPPGAVSVDGHLSFAPATFIGQHSLAQPNIIDSSAT